MIPALPLGLVPLLLAGIRQNRACLLNNIRIFFEAFRSPNLHNDVAFLQLVEETNRTLTEFSVCWCSVDCIVRSGLRCEKLMVNVIRQPWTVNDDFAATEFGRSCVRLKIGNQTWDPHHELLSEETRVLKVWNS